MPSLFVKTVKQAFTLTSERRQGDNQEKKGNHILLNIRSTPQTKMSKRRAKSNEPEQERKLSCDKSMEYACKDAIWQTGAWLILLPPSFMQTGKRKSE